MIFPAKYETDFTIGFQQPRALPAVLLAGSAARQQQRLTHPTPVPPAGEVEMRSISGAGVLTPAGAGQSPAAPREGAGVQRAEPSGAVREGALLAAVPGVAAE